MCDADCREDVETLEEYIIKRYLETLWLPESITSFPHFIKDLRRIIIPPDIDPRELFKPLLLPVDAIRGKYHVQLSRVLQDEGREGEIEETMMWFAYRNEGYHRETEEGGEVQVETARKEWLTKMEYQECENTEQISPPAIDIVPPTPLSPRKPIFSPTKSMSFEQERAKPEKKKKSHIDIEERLELLMDRLIRDWMQVFCEDVVKPLFQEYLPILCDILHSKVFPHSPFSEDSDSDVAAPPVVPMLRTQKKFQAKERCPLSPLKLHEVTKSGTTPMARTLSEYAIPTGSVRQDQLHHRQSIPPKRHRSRSVSVSVEDVRARGASCGGVASSKALFRGLQSQNLGSEINPVSVLYLQETYD
ncbi:hypothetical protein Clacol_010084 [Clathrus columnatus]|uniref:PXA domain-containing protein n=1 Tax=Clathrus columnatus TaxID=1419009 RepID=A0AAV5ASR8_9AGAM|nr:hypothetical protein Clacol_010084 [Clathrus columnatus]